MAGNGNEISAEAPGAVDVPDRHAALVPLSVIAAVWGLWYAIYRGYYALGGRWLSPGVPNTGSDGRFAVINAVAAVVLLVAAFLPLVMLPMWRSPVLRRVLVVLCWLIAVGCCMHAVIDIVQRILSLSGALVIVYPASVWLSVDRREADLQDLFLNEPWFLLEGLLFTALAWFNLSRPGRKWWIASAAAATAVLVGFGLLAAAGVTGRVVVG